MKNKYNNVLATAGAINQDRVIIFKLNDSGGEKESNEMNDSGGDEEEEEEEEEVVVGEEKN